MRLAPGSIPWVLVPLVATLVAVLSPIHVTWAMLPGGLTVLVALFFRDPERTPGDGIVAAADGRVRSAQGGQVVTFLNVHNVHVIRAPYAGTVRRIERLPGGHRPAFLEGAKRNAGLAVTLETDWGALEVHLIAGLVARRAVAYVEAEQIVSKGQRIGIIRFGSRVDVELPAGAQATVTPGTRVRAAESTVAHPPAPTSHPQGASA